MLTLYIDVYSQYDKLITPFEVLKLMDFVQPNTDLVTVSKVLFQQAMLIELWEPAQFAM